MAYYGAGQQTNLESNDDCFDCKKQTDCPKLDKLAEFSWRVNNKIECEDKE